MLPKLILRVGQTNALSAVATLLIGILTSRWLGPADRGQYVIFVTSAGILGTIGTMGLYQAAIYFISKNRLTPAEALGSLIALLIIEGAVLMPLAWFIPDLPSPPMDLLRDRTVALALVVANLVFVAQEGLGGIAMSKGFHGLYLNQRALEPALILIATALLYLFQMSAERAMLVRVGAGVAAVSAMAFSFRRTFPERAAYRLRCLAMEVAFGSKNITQSLIALLNYRVYIYFLAADAASVGQFSIGMLFSELVRFVPTAVSTALLPVLASQSGQDAGRLAARACRYLIAVGITIIAAFALFREPIIKHAFGVAYLPAASPALIMLFGSLIRTAYQIFGNYFTSVGEQAISVTSAAVGLAVALAAAAILIPRGGLEGAALAYLLSSATTSLIIAVRFARHTGIPPAEFLIPNAEDLRSLIVLLRKPA